MRLDGKVALVTGGSRGIGRAVAIRLAEAGAVTYINYHRDESAAHQTCRLVTEAGGVGRICRFDVANLEHTRASIGDIIQDNSRLDILVNNAGITIDGLLVRMKESDWDQLIGTNLKGALNCCHCVSRMMIRQKSGRIINIASVVAEAGNAGQAAYSASKAGILGLTKSLARELAPRSICVNAVAPGLIKTDMTASLAVRAQEKILEQIPLARLGTPEDVAGVVAFLASEEAGYITGQIIRVNGGLYM
jgi:3-oxoacyl-[acyl-carrier protein] reductase